MSDVLATNLTLTGLYTFVFHISCHFRRKEVGFIIIFKFCFSFFHPHLCLVIIPSRNCVRCVENNIFVTHDRLLHLITTLRSFCTISDQARNQGGAGP